MHAVCSEEGKMRL